MIRLLDRARLAERTRLAAGELHPLATSLVADLREVVERPLYVPEQKALLSRAGGRCADDGAMLDFDPFSPGEHRCPKCGATYTGELHDRFWIYWYQLWLAERALHGAVLSRLGVFKEGAAFAASVLDAYSDLYLKYPNVDNALGPTRPFFSTYLESIWLLQLCIASSQLYGDYATDRTVGRFRESVVAPSLALVESFDEGDSNRQVWNNAAMIAGHLTLGHRGRAEKVIWSASGVAHHLGTSLLGDGSWYEGENYHLFAHRGLWYAIALAEASGFELPPELVTRYETGFVSPFLTSLPDLTFPSRRDSQYAISLRQWRFAEWCELGLARTDDRILAGMVSRLYAEDIPRGDTGRWKSAAEAERNLPPARLSRSDLGWKSLLFARESLPATQARPLPSVLLTQARPLPSVLLDGQGIGVIRRDGGNVYAALDYGVSGGGHGHPDRLNLLLFNGGSRLLDDMGTGSYVDPSLHWYRSSLAHNAPFIDGKSQPRVDGTLVAFDDRGAAGWIVATAPLARDVFVTRAVVTMPDYLVDEVTWRAPTARPLDLPLHADLTLREPGSETTQSLTGSQGLEDGFRFVREATLLTRLAAEETVSLTGPLADMWVASTGGLEIWRVVAPGAPGKGDAPFILLRGSSNAIIRSIWSWKGAVRKAQLFPSISVETAGERHEHASVEHGWNIAIHVNGAKSTIDLEGLVPKEKVVSTVGFTNAVQHRAEIPRVPQRFAVGARMHGTLGQESYLRTEESWLEAGSPTADVELVNEGGGLRIIADVHAERSFVSPGTVNRLDNEHADINGAGMQLYLRSDVQTAGYVIVPIKGTEELSFRPIDGWGDDITVAGTWRPIADGYHMEVVVRPPAAELSVNLAINEKPEDRERRRGQLFLPHVNRLRGWLYLAGDRQPHPHMIDLILER
jgi:hypothetical protein